MNKNIGILYAVRLTSHLSFIGGVLIPFFTDWGGITPAMIPLIQLWFMWWAAILEIPSGMIADYVSRKASLVWGLAVSGVGFVVYVLAPELVFFLIGEFLIALGLALVSGADESLLYDTLLEQGRPEVATHISSRCGIFAMVGILIGSPIGSWVGVTWGYHVPNILTGATLLLSAVVALFLTEPTVVRTTVDPTRTYRDIASRGLRLFWHNKTVRQLGFNFAVVHALAGTIIWLNQVVLTDLGVNPLFFGYVVSAGVVSEIIFAHYVGSLEERFGFGKMVVATQLMPALGFVLVVGGVFGQNIPTALVGILMAYAVLIGRRSMMKAHINHAIPSSERATILSTVELVRKGITGFAYIVMSLTLDVGAWLPMAIFAGVLIVGLNVKR